MSVQLTYSTTDKEGYENGVSVILYGESGSGKTHILGTYPIGKLLILSTERKLLTLKDKKIPVIVINSFEELQAAINFVSVPSNVANFDVVAIDSITNIAKILQKELSLQHSDKWAVYRLLSEQMDHELNRFLSIRKHKVVVAQQGSMDVGNGVNKNAPSFPGKALIQAIPYKFDHILCAKVTVGGDGNTSFQVQTVPDYQYIAKGSSKLLPIEAPDLPTILGKILS